MQEPLPCWRKVYFNPRFPRGKRPYGGSACIQTDGYFNPRFPRGKRLQQAVLHGVDGIFQSTLPAGEATEVNCAFDKERKFQSTLPAGEATHTGRRKVFRLEISIHASRGGSDFQRSLQLPVHILFQSTLPAGEATTGCRKKSPAMTNFNPRFPRGKRPPKDLERILSTGFQSTLPAGEATVRSSCPLMTARSSIGSANRVFPVFYQRFPCSFSFGRWGFALTGSWCHWGHILSLFLYE